MTTYEWVSSVLGVIGLAGGVVGFFVAFAARRKASRSEAIALQARTDSAAALTRSADATERVAEIWEKMSTPPPPEVEFEVVPPTGLRPLYMLKNVGQLEARGVTIVGEPEQVRSLVLAKEADLPPGKAVGFSTDARLGLYPRQIRVAWKDDNGDHTDTLWL